MFTPSSDAIFMSCSQARCWRPSDVRLISKVKPTITSDGHQHDDDLLIGDLRR